MFKRKVNDIDQLTAEIRANREEMEKAAALNDPDKYSELFKRDSFLRDRLRILTENKDHEKEAEQARAKADYNTMVNEYNQKYKAINNQLNGAIEALAEAFRTYTSHLNEANKIKTENRAGIPWQSFAELDQFDQLPTGTETIIRRLLLESKQIDAKEAERMRVICNGSYISGDYVSLEDFQREINRKAREAERAQIEAEKKRRQDITERIRAGKLGIDAADWLQNYPEDYRKAVLYR